ncbi:MULTISPECIES: hypothetical protein [Ramlibacter]|uniref:DUF2116 family Zn-ribbon domain-containing protein n=1 Tax=Ramlibacter pinisoli TaxID=2682844 RepID=A0A6N8IRI9_9BURK|nr:MULTISPECIES: hypothetical protein [Ramlibacter]MBA2964376.1 hypothetical protein [Ramlibacter sp. CGMCC 1.13660]MVQ29342.1 hypothetical protein [Ramlibacter pinisoli]
MADVADLAFDSEQRYLAQALAAQTRQRVLQPMGSCHHCGNDAIGQGLFCDPDCAADWEYQDALRRRLGLPARGWTADAAAATQH